MDRIVIILFFFVGISFAGYSQSENEVKSEGRSIYDFTVKHLSVGEFDFSTLKGKKIMIVNTASKCGYTGQYADLQKLYKQYADSNFVIICFPSGSFGQEYKTPKKIEKFCDKNYGITFPMMGRISVTGGQIHPIYKFLTDSLENGQADSDVDWNFQKYLIDVNGHLYKKILPATSPTTVEVIEWIEEN